MKKVFSSLIIFSILCQLSFAGCQSTEIDYSKYKSEKGYNEYISDVESDIEESPYYNITEAMTIDKKAINYYKRNSRQIGDFMVTNYRDGICINRFVGELKDNKIIVPEKIDNLPVIKIGCTYNEYERNNEDIYKKFYGAFDGYAFDVVINTINSKPIEIHLPATIKYISHFSVDAVEYTPSLSKNIYGYLYSFVIDDNNPYYTSENGILYTKNKEEILYQYEEYPDIGLSE